VTSILGRVMLAFDGETVPGAITRRLAEAPAAGVTLFRHHNVRSPGQVRELSRALQRAAAAGPTGGPLLIAADQEAGQLVALGDATTPFAGNMALGAVDDEALTERVAAAIGREARAMGVDVVYAPSLDLATNPDNPGIGVRSFGDDPALVGRHGTAFLRGLASVGAVGAVKHFPGLGDVAGDSHHGLPHNDADRATLDRRELAPFRAVTSVGRSALAAPFLVMSGHLALPAVTGRDDVVSTLSRAVMTDLLRGELGFAGLTISDALDMGAITGAAYGAGAEAGVADVVAAVRAGVDLLLTMPDALARDRIEAALLAASFETAEVAATERRVGTVRAWLTEHAAPRPDLDVVASTAHAALADELAARAVTVVREPRRPALIGRVLAVMPRPADLTPADTSSTVAPALADALRRYHPDVDELVIDQRPDAAAIAALRERAAAADAVVIGTIDAHRQREQLAAVEAVALAGGGPVTAVALRGPWDVAGYPTSVGALATYAILRPSLDAMAAVLAGRAEAPGRLPVRLPG
jgi:beta-N-acetylhexosaminidase